MGDRSDRQWHGTHDSADWKKGARRKSRGLEKTPEQQARNVEAYCANSDRIYYERIKRDQLPRFREENGIYSREYTANTLKGASTLFTDTGLKPENIQCSCALFPECKNLASLIEAVDVFTNRKKLADATVIVSLSNQQFEHITQFYSPTKDGPTAER